MSSLAYLVLSFLPFKIFPTLANNSFANKKDLRADIAALKVYYERSYKKQQNIYVVSVRY
jgi:hypothetical protein